MNSLKILQNGIWTETPFEGTPLLADALQAAGCAVERPCGGRGMCGKCAAVVSGAVSEPNAAERRMGVRLACQTVLLGDAQVILPDARQMEQIETAGMAREEARNPMPGRYGAAVDIGTTTIALKLYDLARGVCVGEAGMRNPQTAVAADVMGRIGAALEGKGGLLQGQVAGAINALLHAACGRAGCAAAEVDALVVTGNTTMLYLLTGRDVAPLSRAPFDADCLFDLEADVLGRRAYLPPCMNAFVGADISCAVLCADQCAGGPSLLADIGTNGEIALWKDGTLYVSSTAAGPAFEGAGISCGCSSVRGAIDRVWLEDGRLRAHTIGGERAMGICGSGLIDAVACLLETGAIDGAGRMESDSAAVWQGVALRPKDISAVQLAKAAIAAGIQTVMETAGVSEDEIGTLYIAGGFGSHINVESAAAIGLIPPKLKDRVMVVGNGALGGAAMLLLDRDRHGEIRGITARSTHVRLSGNSRFSEHFVDQLAFFED